MSPSCWWSRPQGPLPSTQSPEGFSFGAAEEGAQFSGRHPSAVRRAVGADDRGRARDIVLTGEFGIRRDSAFSRRTIARRHDFAAAVDGVNALGAILAAKGQLRLVGRIRSHEGDRIFGDLDVCDRLQVVVQLAAEVAVHVGEDGHLQRRAGIVNDGVFLGQRHSDHGARGASGGGSGRRGGTGASEARSAVTQVRDFLHRHLLKVQVEVHRNRRQGWS